MLNGVLSEALTAVTFTFLFRRLCLMTMDESALSAKVRSKRFAFGLELVDVVFLDFEFLELELRVTRLDAAKRVLTRFR